MEKSKLKRILLIIAGSVSVGIGTFGLLVPVLPTTPFLLLAAFCYVRSSKRLNGWLMGHKIFGKYIYNYMTHRAISRRAKVCSIILLWAGLAVSAYFVMQLWIKLLLLAVGIGVSAHLLLLQTLESNDEGE